MTISVLLEKSFEVLKPYLNKKGLVEISINKPGEIWLEDENGEWTFKKDRRLTLTKLDNLAKNLATENGQDFDDETPMLSLALPKWGYRLQVISGPATDSGFSLSIRVGAAKDLPLSSWFDDDQIKNIERLIENRKTILVSGGTGSGKTTLLNALVKKINNSDRIVSLEDSKELVIRQPNHVRLLKSKTGTDVAALSNENFTNAIMRFRPDRILLGEIDIGNTLNFLRLINTGHNGLFTTIHANSIDSAISGLVMNCTLSGLMGGDDKIREYALRHIDNIIQVKRTVLDGKRVFSAEIGDAK